MPHWACARYAVVSPPCMFAPCATRALTLPSGALTGGVTGESELMATNEGMTIERTDDTLIVRSMRRGINWIGAVFAAFSLFWTLFWNRHDAQSEGMYWLGLGGGIIFILIGISLLLPRRILTVFDLRSQRVRRSMAVFGYVYRDQTFQFSEIAGVGIVEGSQIDNRDAMPVLIVKTGPPLPLNTVRTYRVGIGDIESGAQVGNICAATGRQNVKE